MTTSFVPTMSRSRRQISSYVYLFDKIEREGILLSSLPHVEELIDRAVDISSGDGWEVYGNTFKQLIRNNDLHGLKNVLLSPTEDRYRSISPLLMLLLTPEEGRTIRDCRRVVSPEMLTID